MDDAVNLKDFGSVRVVPPTRELVLRVLASRSGAPGILDGSDREAVISAARDAIDADALSDEYRMVLVDAGFPELDD